jgi:MarR family transcriptional regulator, organic hydroperoxide resistance regulator
MAVDPTTITLAEHEELAVRTTRRHTPDIDDSAMRVGLSLVRASNSLVGEAESTIQRAFGLSWPSFRVLFIVWMYGELEARSIARIAGVTRQSVSSVLATVERHGFIEREKSNGPDRRLIEVRLTTAGQKVVQQAFALHNRVESHQFAALTAEERHQLATLLAKITRAPAEVGWCPG